MCIQRKAFVLRTCGFWGSPLPIRVHLSSRTLYPVITDPAKSTILEYIARWEIFVSVFEPQELLHFLCISFSLPDNHMEQILRNLKTS